MLSKRRLEEILSRPLPDLPAITGVEWQTQNSGAGDILFYRITEDERSEALFRERIETARYALVVINRAVLPLPPNAVVIEESEWKEVQKLVCDELFPLPALPFIAVTGTNGKTTTTELILQLGALCGVQGLSIGTLGVRVPGKTLVDFGLTSPSYIDFRKFLSRYGQGRDFCAMEVSSHALLQDRFYKIEFAAAGWTSFSQDHLDYHETMENYFESKLLLVERTKGQQILVPEGQRELRRLIEEKGKRVLPVPPIDGEDLPLFLRSTFNRENLALAWELFSGLFPTFLSPDFTRLTPPEGRFYIREAKGGFIVVDFAHTPDALANICRSIRESFPGKELRVLFGCGGDRDRRKRPLMTRVVREFAQKIYLTSDNPRTEDPEAIIQDMLEGNADERIEVIVDRKAAVSKALGEIGSGVVLLLAGKGHENTISINGKKIHYSDIEEVEKFIAGN